MPVYDFSIKAIASVHDGDTCKVVLDFGFGISFDIDIRMEGIDTPEMMKESKPAAIIARDALVAWLNARVGSGNLRLASKSWDKYGGRALGGIYVSGTNEKAADYMIAQGLAKPYQGDKKIPWTTDELKKITDKK